MNKVRACMLHRFSHARLFATPWTPGSSDHGILQARVLEWVAGHSSRGSSQPRDQTKSPGSPALAGGFFTISATSIQFSHLFYSPGNYIQYLVMTYNGKESYAHSRSLFRGLSSQLTGALPPDFYIHISRSLSLSFPQF